MGTCVHIRESRHVNQVLMYVHAVVVYVHRRPNGQEGFVPVNYVKEVEPAVIRNITKKKVVKPVKVKLRKKRIEQRKLPKRRSTSALSNCVHTILSVQPRP